MTALFRARWRQLGVGLLVACAAAVAYASSDQRDRIEALAESFFPGVHEIGRFEGSPRAAPVFDDHDRLLGYVFLTDDVVRIPAYSGKPISALVGLDTTGHITGVHIVHHSEPILVTGVSEDDIHHFVGQYQGKDATRPIHMREGQDENAVGIDGLTGATITAMVLNASITRAARTVAASRGLPLPSREVSEAYQEEHDQGEEVAHEALAGAPSPAAGAAAPRAGGVPFAGGSEETEPLWVPTWRARKVEIGLLSAGLVVLSAILVLQDWLVRNRKLVTYLRNGFLVYTLVFIGWYELAQLSIVNVLTFTNALMRDFRWETFLIDPLIFILWGFVAMTLLLWGRGVFCGWLCPYGALQELVSKISQGLRVPQLEIPPIAHERLLAIKYVILLLLFGVSLQSMRDAVRYAEVEPFKTAINMHFLRAWPFVLYAAAFVLISAFNSKFFCKYVCPLGAALTIPGRFRIFDWLRRRKECGRPCQICAVECPSQAIRPTGEINPNECHYCLDCQITYWDAHKCPPLVEKRRRFEKRGRELKLKVR
jgi:NosR/NirI family nitrous oxide reductase transcriptional regulator